VDGILHTAWKGEVNGMFLLILHHPLIGVFHQDFDPPVDYANVIYHDVAIPGQEIEARDEDRFLRLKMDDESDGVFRAQSDFSYLDGREFHIPRNFELRKDCRYHVCEEICDAMESWDFVLSDHDIEIGRWLEGYSQERAGRWVCGKDLAAYHEARQRTGDSFSLF
jgi:hypothetical protein